MLPRPRIILSWWTFGSLLGLCLAIQLLRGIFLSLHYIADRQFSFSVVLRFREDVNEGWLLRFMHANGASFFFIALYAHVSRGLYYGSFIIKSTWLVGVLILILVIAAAFLGYVLPWGQMSFWGATVITSLITALPIVGHSIVLWVWGGFSVDRPTLTRFFSFHFLIPFVLAAAAALHVFFLHSTGSSNPLGNTSNKDKVTLRPYFLFKDLVGYSLFFGLLVFLRTIYPWDLGDPENFIPANPLIAPLHIQPEWYFLFAYAILRSIPSKLGGVLAIFRAFLIFAVLTILKVSSLPNNRFSKRGKFLFWFFIWVAILLTWIGARPVEYPYIQIGQILRVLYFCFFFLRNWINELWFLLLKN